MARRRTIQAPSVEELERLDRDAAAVGFAAKPRVPIAQVAGEAAALASPLPAADQEARARDRADAAALRRAREEGWEVRELPLAEIRIDAIPRDRMSLDAEAMEELRASIRANGLRLPVEVSPREGGGWDLVSGLRRLMAMRDVAGEGGTIRAFVRPARTAPEQLVAMVEENEVRADLSSYERGRAAVLAVQDGAFPSVAAAVDALFATASKAKRSKVRSFALVHEELGDLLSFPQALSERQCLRLAAAIKAGQGGALRASLAPGGGADAEAEWAEMAAALATVEPPPAASGGRRRVRGREPGPGREDRPRRDYIPLANGMAIRHVVDDRGRHTLRFEGPADAILVEQVMREIERLLEPIGDGRR
jgi:ParB family chromosome partitioning protein